MTTPETWPEGFGVDLESAAAWVEEITNGPARFRQVLRHKLWGFTTLFTTAHGSVVFKVASPPLFPAAPVAHAAAHGAAPDAVPELLASEDRGSQHWSLFANVDGAPARTEGPKAAFAIADIVATIQVRVASSLPADIPVVPAASVAALLAGLDDVADELVTELDEQRDQLSTWGQELDALVPLSLDHVDLHLGNALRTPDDRFVVLDWEEAVVSCPLFSFNRLRVDAADHGVARLAERAYLDRLLPTLEETQRRRAMDLANVLAPLKLAYEARVFASQLGWSYPHTLLTTRYLTESLEAASTLVGRKRPRPPRPTPPALGVEAHDRGCGEVCRNILSTLPDWFGIPEANEEYIAAAETSLTFVASLDGVPVGLLVPIRHSDSAAEIHLVAVAEPHRRKGIGRALIEEAERSLLIDGVTILQVKTLSARRADDGYEETRAFYRSLGFVHLEEHPTLWNPHNPALQLVKTIGQHPA